MTLDTLLDKMTEAMACDNYHDVECYSKMSLDYIAINIDEVNKSYREELIQKLTILNHQAQLSQKKISDYEKYKRDLIEQIVNFK